MVDARTLLGEIGKILRVDQSQLKWEIIKKYQKNEPESNCVTQISLYLIIPEQYRKGAVSNCWWSIGNTTLTHIYLSLPEQHGKWGKSCCWPIFQVHWNHCVGEHLPAFCFSLSAFDYFCLLLIAFDITSQSARTSSCFLSLFAYFWFPLPLTSFG